MSMITGTEYGILLAGLAVAVVASIIIGIIQAFKNR